jgi:hypothetical protein
MKISLGHLFAITLTLLCISNPSFSHIQSDSVWKSKPSIYIGGFLDVYYFYDFNSPIGHRQPFLFNHNRHNEFNVNNALLQFNLAHQKYRVNIGLHAGTYAHDNYAHEQMMLRSIYEANVGISLSKKNNLWLDAGIFSSHMGFESALSIENPTLTRSLVAENSPYYLSGVKLTYIPSEKLEIAAILSNGWQRIQRITGSSLPSGGTQIIYNPSDKITLNWSTFVTSEFPDSTRRMRYFSNIFAQFQATKKFSLIVGFDCGAEQAVKNSVRYNPWLAPVLIARYDFSHKWGAAVRTEYFHDEYNTIINTGNSSPIQLFGSSLTIDYSPIEQISCRIEGRFFQNSTRAFDKNNTIEYSNFFIGASLGIKFGKTWN